MNGPSYESPDSIADPIGDFSHLSRAGDLLFLAGQIGADETGELAKDLEGQVRLTFANLEALLASQGATLRDVLRFTTYLSEGASFERFRAARSAVYAEAYPDRSYPPNSLAIVSSLAKPEILVEIDAVAHAPRDR